jgi:type IV pilus assembly protein PilA
MESWHREIVRMPGFQLNPPVAGSERRVAHRVQWPVAPRMRKSRGFTLVELMVVIAIVAVLAVIAIVAYRSILNSSKVSEAQHMVNAIRSAQEAYHAETLRYADVSASATSTYPASAPGQFKTQWGAACGSACNASPTWTDLGVHVDGPVQFGYVTKAGAAGIAPTPASIVVNAKTVTLPANPATDWYFIGATADLDGKGGTGFGAGNTNVYATSWSNEVWVDNDGQ